MATTDTIIIGAGQAGLAASRCLIDRAVDHVVLERGRVAERWRSERWDSLRLLTPNWMTRLPGWQYDGRDRHGFMAAGEVVEFFERYATSFDAPVREESSVDRVRLAGDGYEVVTSDGTWRAGNVVIATGWCDRPAVPPAARNLAAGIHQIVPSGYRNPTDVPEGGVLVVGASATGVQLADELRGAGRDVIVAVGGHTRLPRRYRGMDIYWWLERIGRFDKTIDEMPDVRAARREPSLQLVGSADGRPVDLTTLRAAGVELAGRVTSIDGWTVTFAEDLDFAAEHAERRTRAVLADIDRYVERSGLAAEVLPPEPLPPLRRAGSRRQIDLRAAGINTVIWATGHRRTYPWLDVPVLDGGGEVRQRRGVTPAPGLYVLGQRFQHYRNSNFIDGVGRDAAFVADHLTHRLTQRPVPARP